MKATAWQTLKAYSYSRVSSGKQTTGSGLDRQTALAESWAERKGLELDDSLRLSDAGKSAYKGKHLQGALGRFVQLAEAGQIERGSYLLVEAIDRISRLEPLNGLQDVIFKLVGAGIRLVTLEDGVEYSQESITEDTTRLVILVVKIGEAYKYGKRLATRVSAAHLKREADLGKGVERSIGQLPFWVSRQIDGQLVLNDRVEIVREIYRYSEQGLGGHRIARELNQRGLLTVSGRPWSPVNVNHLFTKPAVCGDAVFRGKVYADLYPAAITRQQYEAAKHRRAQSPGRRGGFASADQMHWIGQGLTYCSGCGSSLGVNSGTNRDGSRRFYLRCKRSSTGSCASKGWPLDQSTSYLLSRLTTKALEEVLGRRLDTRPMEAEVSTTRVALEAADGRLKAAQLKAIEAAQDPEVSLGLMKVLASANTAAETAVHEAERRHLEAQARYQAARAKEVEIELPDIDRESVYGRKLLNDGLVRLGLRIEVDWSKKRWGMSLPGTEICWSTFGPDSWLEFDWIGPPEEDPEWINSCIQHHLNTND